VAFAIEGGLQLVPWPGMLALSKVMASLAIGGVMVGLHAVAHGGRLRASCLLAGLRRPVPVAAVGLIILAVQLAFASALFGASEVAAVVRGQHRPAAGFTIALILPGLVPGTLLMLAAPLALLEDRAHPLKESAGRVLSEWAAFGWFALISAALVAGALLLAGVPLLLVVPWQMASAYAVYQDVRAR
jgi:hypothetical protein